MKSSVKKRGSHALVPEYLINKAGIFQREATYEIEIELIDTKSADLMKYFKIMIKYILSGLQETNFPISLTTQNKVIQNYSKILYPKENYKNIKKKDFIGPSSISLQLHNIREISIHSKGANIRLPYTVTEKADGQRKLLFIAENGGIYLININMKIQFVGIKCVNTELFNTIVDGEHILHDKNGKFLNLFLAFDIYYIKKVDCRNLPLLGDESRLSRLNIVLQSFTYKSVSTKNNFKLRMKTFYKSEKEEIFENCKKNIRKRKKW